MRLLTKLLRTGLFFAAIAVIVKCDRAIEGPVLEPPQYPIGFVWPRFDSTMFMLSCDDTNLMQFSCHLNKEGWVFAILIQKTDGFYPDTVFNNSDHPDQWFDMDSGWNHVLAPFVVHDNEENLPTSKRLPTDSRTMFEIEYEVWDKVYLQQASNWDYALGFVYPPEFILPSMILIDSLRGIRLRFNPTKDALIVFTVYDYVTNQAVWSTPESLFTRIDPSGYYLLPLKFTAPSNDSGYVVKARLRGTWPWCTAVANDVLVSATRIYF